MVLFSQKYASPPAKAHAAVLSAGCMWGSVGIFVRLLDRLGYSPLTIVFVRMFIAFILLFTFLYIFNRNLLRIKIKDIWLFIGAALTSAIALNLFYSISTVMNSLALAAVLLATAPFFVIFMSAIMFKEKITPVKLMALFIAFAGCVLTSGFIGSVSKFSPLGVLVGVLPGAGYAFYSIFLRFALNKGYDSLTINVYSFGIGAIACIPFTKFGVIVNSVGAEPAYMSIFLVAHALFVSLLPYLLYTYCMKYMDTGKAAILVSVEPAAAAVFGVVLYNEIPTVVCLLGIVLVIVAIIVLNMDIHVWRSRLHRFVNR